MSIVVEQGTIRNDIRGIDEVPFHIALFEPIDDRQHSNSKEVFVDLDTKNKQFIIGFENAANEEQINNMVRWNTSQAIHIGDGMATAGKGLKIYEYLARGLQYHGSYYFDADNNIKYLESKVDSSKIFEAARNSSVSESEFSTIANKNTTYAQVTEEIITSVNSIYGFTEDSEYNFPFKPKTIFISKKISNQLLLDSLNEDSKEKNKPENTILYKELLNKYFHEIFKNDLKLWIRFPNFSEFTLLKAEDNADPIGMTIAEDIFNSEIYEVKNSFKNLAKSAYIMKIFNKYFKYKPNGNSFLRDEISITKLEEEENLILIFHFMQYVIADRYMENVLINMPTKAMEPYQGIYLLIGDKLNNNRPLPTRIPGIRNAYGNNQYRGILKIASQNANYVKNKLQLNGLKAKFNLSDMPELENVVKNLILIYKKFMNTNLTDKDTHPEKYVCIKSTNEKTKPTDDKLLNIYMVQVGNNFYKLGISNGMKRLGYYNKEENKNSLKTDFPDEEIVENPEVIYFSLNACKNANSLEQQLKEYLLELDDVITYNAKKGNTIREYFHCDNLITLEDIKNFIKSNIKY